MRRRLTWPFDRVWAAHADRAFPAGAIFGVLQRQRCSSGGRACASRPPCTATADCQIRGAHPHLASTEQTTRFPQENCRVGCHSHSWTRVGSSFWSEQFPQSVVLSNWHHSAVVSNALPGRRSRASDIASGPLVLFGVRLARLGMTDGMCSTDIQRVISPRNVISGNSRSFVRPSSLQMHCAFVTQRYNAAHISWTLICHSTV